METIETTPRHAVDALPLAADDVVGIMDRVRADGFALVRGLPPDPRAFQTCTDRFGLAFEPYEAQAIARRNVPGVDASITTVDEGWGPIGWHAEASCIPGGPELIFFFCVRPASIAGETLLVDGGKVYSGLPDAFREVAGNTQLLYAGTFDRHQPDAIAALLSALHAESIEALAQISANLATREGERWELKIDADVVTYRFTRPLVRPSKWSSDNGICAFFVGPLLNADGTSVSAALRQVISGAAFEHSYFHSWHEGDLLVVDNTRLMHARNAFNDRNRRVLVRMGSYPPNGGAAS